MRIEPLNCMCRDLPDYKDKPAVYVEPIQKIVVYTKCTKCGEDAEVDTSVIYTSYPPCQKWTCKHCGAVGWLRGKLTETLDKAIPIPCEV